MLSPKKEELMDSSRLREVMIPADGMTMWGDLGCPQEAKGIVVFAHGSGSSRKSPRNRFVADYLGNAGLATLLLDLLSPAEDAREAAGGRLRFDIEVLARRLQVAAQWVQCSPLTRGLPLGYFGASTGAAAALQAAAAQLGQVRAVVSRGGRPDLVPAHLLARVTASTLLIVGSADHDVLELNRMAATRLRCEHRLEIVPGATHLFEEPGTLEQVAAHAGRWFERQLTSAQATSHREHA
jgi:putative phosphoribosyl transferase